MTLSNFHSVIPHLKTFYGMSVSEEDVEDIGLEAWDKIGNKRTNMYSFSGTTNNCSLNLPCNAYRIEAVTDTGIPFRKTDNKLAYNYQNRDIEEYAYRVSSSFFQTKGNFVDYELNIDQTSLIFKKDYGTINVLYKGLQLDDDGLPLLTDKEKSAIALYIAYVIKFKEALITHDRATAEFSEVLSRKWKVACGDARTNYINQNEWDKILNAKTSWNRKSFNVSLKPVY